MLVCLAREGGEGGATEARVVVRTDAHRPSFGSTTTEAS